MKEEFIMKKILILSSTTRSMNNALKPILNRIKELHPDMDMDMDMEIITSTFGDLDFYIAEEDTKITISGTGIDVANFDLVIFRTIGSLKEEAMATATYLKAKNVKFFDRNYPKVWGRIGQAFERWQAGIKMPRTVAGTNEGLEKGLGLIGIPAVLKATNSRQGQNNFLVNNVDELRNILAENPETKYALTEFIPNDGDYRVLVLGFDNAVVSYRTGKEGSHLNYDPVYGTQKVITDHESIANVIDIAKRVAVLDELSIVGVDVIVNKNTGQEYILEANRAPQMLTIDEEIDGFYHLILKELE